MQILIKRTKNFEFDSKWDVSYFLPNLHITVWKFQNFPVIQISCEINHQGSRQIVFSLQFKSLLTLNLVICGRQKLQKF